MIDQARMAYIVLETTDKYLNFFEFYKSQTVYQPVLLEFHLSTLLKVKLSKAKFILRQHSKL